jgi:hypothetical protein
MVPRELLEQVEGIRFAAEVGVVSSERLFESAIRQHPLVLQLFGYLTDPQAREQIAVRLTDLLYRDSDPRYEHPHDAAVAVYLRLLDVSEPGLASLAAVTAARQPNLWWARSVAIQILEGAQTRVSHDVGTVTVDSAGDVARTVTTTTTHTTWGIAPKLGLGTLLRSASKQNEDTATTPLSPIYSIAA